MSNSDNGLIMPRGMHNDGNISVLPLTSPQACTPDTSVVIGRKNGEAESSASSDTVKVGSNDNW